MTPNQPLSLNPLRTAAPPTRPRATRARRAPAWRLAAATLCLAGAALQGCSSPPVSTVTGPMSALPAPAPLNLERVNNGSLFQPGMTSASMFMDRRKPRSIGDTLKVDIAESINASNALSTDNSRDNAMAVKGPGVKGVGSGIIRSLLNLDASASGSDSYKGTGKTTDSSSFTGQLAATVINVLPNGNLVVAGERSVALNGGVRTLRFSGVVDPKDLKSGNVVASSDVVNARLEMAGQGDVSEAAQRNWLQRVLTNSLSVW
ncbi:flagellar basal body L-ring protein FlgH [Curvibacter sp. RS43]|uniref:flagellar basal body L-ring protein FlgH n=1 Tax=Curvibacter microcysteis TaxID=3026419 RepID=UPI00235E8CF0|nr:flagellar basal body L-ring protein FlgH [Curvibacter sp. RS43]MDD0812044.1 flagellar basal body L-ring protein FlgH [Curvibacter sp. RS43]